MKTLFLHSKILAACFLIFCGPFIYSQCNQNGCDQIEGSQWRGQVALWPGDNLDCNGDEGENLLDLLCLLHEVTLSDSPVIQNPPPLRALVGREFVHQFQANDPNGDTVTFGSPDLMDHASLDDSGLFRFEPTEAQMGTHAFTIEASDGFLVSQRIVEVKVGTPLQVERTFPDDQSVGIALNQRLVVYLADPVRQESVSNSSVILSSNGQNLQAQVQRSNCGHFLIAIPDADWPQNATIDVRLKDLLSEDFFPLASDYRFSFSTGATPVSMGGYIEGLYPLDPVPLNAVLSLDFDVEVDPSTVDETTIIFRHNQTGLAIDGTYFVGSNLRRCIFVPSSVFQVDDDYSLETLGCRTLWGQDVQKAHSMVGSFRTASEFQLETVELVDAFPNQGTADFLPTAKLLVRFNVPVQPIAEDIELVDENTGAPVSFAVSLFPAHNILQVAPLAELNSNQAYSLILKGSLRSFTGDTLGSELRIGFSTTDNILVENPELLWTDPALSQVVAVDTPIVLQYSQPLNPIHQGLVLPIVETYGSQSVYGTARLEDSSRRIVFSLNSSLIHGQSYWDTDSIILFDMLGNPFPFTGYLAFSTGYYHDGQLPFFLGSSPPDGSVEVPVNARIRARFNERLYSAQATLSSNGSDVPVGVYRYSQWVELYPFSNWDPSATYVVQLFNLRDYNGNPLDDISWRFTTSSSEQEDQTSPSVVSMVPAPGSEGRTPDEPITLTFSEVIDPTSIDEGSFNVYLLGSNEPYPGTISFTGASLVFQPDFTPSRNIPALAQVMVEVTSDVTDLAGNDCDAFTGFYQIGDMVDSTPPTIAQSSPADGSVNNPGGQPIEIEFSEVMDRDSFYYNGSQPAFQLYSNQRNIVHFSHQLSDDSKHLSIDYYGHRLSEETLFLIFDPQVCDLSGNPLDPQVLSFHALPTAQDPWIRSEGSTPSTIDSPFQSLFFQSGIPLDPTSIQHGIQVYNSTNLSSIEGEIILHGDLKTLEFIPSTAWPRVFRAYVLSSIKSVVGRPMRQFERSFSFSRGQDISIPFQMIAHSVLDFMPANSQFGLLFNRAVDENQSLEEVFLLLQSGSANPVPIQVYLTHDAHRIVVVPEEPLDVDSDYSLQTVGTLMDTNGNNWTGFQESFHTTGAVQGPILAEIEEFAGDFYSNPNYQKVQNLAFFVKANAPIDATTLVDLFDSERFPLPFRMTPISYAPFKAILFPNQLWEAHTAYRFEFGELASVTGSQMNLAPLEVSFQEFVLDVNGPTLSFPLSYTSDTSGFSTILTFDEPVFSFNDLNEFAYFNSGDPIVTSRFSDDYSHLEIETQTPMPTSNNLYFKPLYDQAGNSTTHERVYISIGNPPTTPLTVDVSYPQDGQADLPRNTQVSFRFNRTPILLEGVNCFLTKGGIPVPFTITQHDAQVSLIPDSHLDPNCQYDVRLDGVQDRLGNLLEEPMAFSFETGNSFHFLQAQTLLVEPKNSGLEYAPSNGYASFLLNQPLFSPEINDEDQSHLQLLSEPDSPFYAVVPTDPLAGLRLQVQGFTRNGSFFTSSSPRFNPTDGIDEMPPELLWFSIGDGSLNVPINSIFSFVFDEKLSEIRFIVDEALSLFDGDVEVPFEAFFTNQNRTVEIVPIPAFRNGATIRWELSGYKDLAWNEGLPRSGSFTMSSPGHLDEVSPWVTNMTPASESTMVPTDSSVELVFNENILASSIDSHSILVSLDRETPIPIPGHYEYHSNRIVFRPEGRLPSNVMIRVDVAPTLLDYAGNPCIPFTGLFWTVPTVDVERPYIVNRWPTPEQSFSRIPNPFWIEFSELINPETVDLGDISIITETGHVPIEALNLQGTRLEIEPDFSSDPGPFDVYVGGDISDFSNNLMVPHHFRIDSEDQTTSCDDASVSVNLQSLDNREPIHLGFLSPVSADDLRDQFSVTFDQQPLEGQIQESGTRQHFTWVPQEPWPLNNQVIIHTPNVISVDGRVTYCERNYGITFYSNSRAYVTADSLYKTPVNVVPRFQFSKPINPSSIDPGDLIFVSDGVDVNFALSFSDDNRVLTMQPESDLQAGAHYTIILTDGILDHDNIPIQRYERWLMIAAGEDREPPTLLHFSHSDLSGSVPSNTGFYMVFSEQLDPVVWSGLYYIDYNFNAHLAFLHPDLPPFLVFYSGQGGDWTYFFMPLYPIEEGRSYTIEISNFEDNCGNLIEPFSFSIFVEQSQNVEPLRVSMLQPTDGEVSVATSVQPYFLFNQPVMFKNEPSECLRLYDEHQDQWVETEVIEGMLPNSYRIIPNVPLVAGRTYSTQVDEVQSFYYGPNYHTGARFTTALEPTVLDQPQILVSHPSDGENHFGRNAVITLLLNTEVDLTSIYAVQLLSGDGSPIPCDYQWEGRTKQVRLIPDQLLDAETAYRLEIGQLFDLEGNPFPVSSHQFWTNSDVLVDELMTMEWIEEATASETPTGQRLLLSFDQPLNPTTLTAESIQLILGSGAVSWELSEDRKVLMVFTPPIPILNANQRLLLTDIESDSGRRFSLDYPLVPNIEVDSTAPVVVFLSDSGGPLESSTQLFWQLSEPISPYFFEKAPIDISVNGMRVLGDFTIEEDLLTFQPWHPMEPGATYQVNVPGIRDLNGNVSEPYSFTFQTRNPFSVDDRAPLLLSSEPGDESTNNPLRGPIRFMFDEPIAPLFADAFIKKRVNNRTYDIAVDWSVTGSTVECVPRIGELTLGDRVVCSVRFQDFSGNLSTKTEIWFDIETEPSNPITTVVSTFPSDKATVVSSSSPIEMEFSRGVVWVPGAVQVHVNGALSNVLPYSSTHGRNMILYYECPTEGESEVVVSTTQALKDMYGHPVEEYIFTFNTGTEPSQGFPSISMQRFGGEWDPYQSPITLASNSAFHPDYIGEGIQVWMDYQQISGVTQLEAEDHALVFYPELPWKPGAFIHYQLAEGVRDVNGRQFTDFDQSSFIGTDTLVDPPGILLLSMPSHDAGVVPRNPVLQLLMSEALDPNSIYNSNSFLENEDTNELTNIDLTYDEDRFVITVQLQSSLAANQTYSLLLGSIKDLQGDSLNYSRPRFSTGEFETQSPPNWVTISPHNQQSEVPINAPLYCELDGPINLVSLDDQTIQITSSRGYAIPASFEYEHDKRAFRIWPLEMWVPDSTYQITISGVTDQSGNTVPTKTITFYTQSGIDLTPPSLDSYIFPGSCVPKDLQVQLNFSEKGYFAGLYLASNWSYGTPFDFEKIPGSKRTSLTVLPQFDRNAFDRIYLSGHLFDTAGNQVDYSSSAYFCPAPNDVDTTPPEFLSSNPSAEQVDTPINTPIEISFNEPILWNDESTIDLWGPSGILPIDITMVSPGDRLKVQTEDLLEPDSTYTISLDALLDRSANMLAEAISFSFSTGHKLTTFEWPSLLDTIPSHEAENVPRNTNIILQFNTEIILNRSTFTLKDSNFSPVPLEFGSSNSMKWVILNPLVELEPEQGYSLRLNVLGLSGDTLNTYLGFRTGAYSNVDPPELIYTLPESGATDLPVNSTVRFSFDQILDPLSFGEGSVVVEEDGNPFHTIWSVEGSDILLAYPLHLNPNKTYSLSVLEGKSACGVHLAVPLQFAFTTRSDGALDLQVPIVESMTPPPGSTGVDPTSDTILTFSKSIDPLTVNSDTVQIQIANSGLAWAGTYTVVDNLIVFRPQEGSAKQSQNAPPPGSEITVNVTDEVKDRAGNRALPFSEHYFLAP